MTGSAVAPTFGRSGISLPRLNCRHRSRAPAARVCAGACVRVTLGVAAGAGATHGPAMPSGAEAATEHLRLPTRAAAPRRPSGAQNECVDPLVVSVTTRDSDPRPIAFTGA